MKKIKNFFSELKYEMQETNWPSRKKLGKDSRTIFSVLIFFSLFFMFSDFIISFLFNLV